MNRAELKEIKRLFTFKNCCVHRMYGCYIDAEKNIRSTWQQSFLSLPEDEIFRYLDMLRRPLSGGLGKNLMNTGFNADKNGKLLYEICIGNEAALEDYYDMVIYNLDYVGHFVILLACGTYDIPGKAADDSEIEDAEDVYDFVLSCICPVDLQKPGLVYDTEAGSFTNLVTSRMLQNPQIGILYPAFNDRTMDTDACLCYSKAMDDSEREFLESQTGSRLPMPAAKERKAYKNILEGTLGSKGTLEEVRAIEEGLQLLKLDSELDQETPDMGEDDLQALLESAGIDNKRLASLHSLYAAEVGHERLNLDNLGDLRAFTVETTDGRLSLDNTAAKRVEIRQIDGKPMLLLNLDGQKHVTVNGIKIGI